MNNLNENKIIPVEKQIETSVEKPIEAITTKPLITEVVAGPIENPKKQKNLYVIIAIVVGILVLFGASYVGRSITNQQNKLNEEFNKYDIPSDFTLNGNTCHDRFNYLVITRTDSLGNAGDDILVKYKTDKNQNIPCEYIVEDSDFELQNTCSDKTICYHSQYFSNIKDNLLIVDEGTGTSRSYILYDLSKRESIFKDSYSGTLELKDNTLSYWHTTNDIPNKENCSKLDEYLKMGGAKIEAKTSLDITNTKDKKFSEFRCLQAE
jgi:hypothetical protein